MNKEKKAQLKVIQGGKQPQQPITEDELCINCGDLAEEDGLCPACEREAWGEWDES